MKAQEHKGPSPTQEMVKAKGNMENRGTKVAGVTSEEMLPLGGTRGKHSHEQSAAKLPACSKGFGEAPEYKATGSYWHFGNSSSGDGGLLR